MMEEKVHIITERVFGSSRKIQLIGLETVPIIPPPPSQANNRIYRLNNDNTPHTRSIRPEPQPPHDDLIKETHSIHTIHNDIRGSPSSPSSTSSSSSSSSSSRSSSSNTNMNNNNNHSHIHNTMSIESLLSSADDEFQNTGYHHPRQSQLAATRELSIASLLNSENRNNQKRKTTESAHVHSPTKKASPPKKVTLTCYHAAVAQKSYGSEKRFLCPPPIVKLTGCPDDIQLRMSVLSETGETILEQDSTLDEHQTGSFKYLHVANTAKAKQFNLKLDLTSSNLTLCSALSNPISIISKPSKKTAKTRNVSTCIMATSPVSLFNRINSQTVRTKYMSSAHNMLCAKNTSWSAFDIIIVNPPKLPQLNYQKIHNPVQNDCLNHQGKFTCRVVPQQRPSYVTYGTEIILRDRQTGVCSPSLIIKKVDKGLISTCAYGPVSQMQKIALQLASSPEPIYLSASADQDRWLEYARSQMTANQEEKVEDSLCWTMVGIHQFEYEVEAGQLTDQMRQPVLPLLTELELEGERLRLVGQHLIQAAPVPRPLDLWLGTYGPLKIRTVRSPRPDQPHESHWSVDLPSVAEREELGLLLVRQDGLVYQTGRSLLFDAGRWTVVSSSSKV